MCSEVSRRLYRNVRTIDADMVALRRNRKAYVIVTLRARKGGLIECNYAANMDYG
jgi:hypothetical protein